METKVEDTDYAVVICVVSEHSNQATQQLHGLERPERTAPCLSCSVIAASRQRSEPSCSIVTIVQLLLFFPLLPPVLAFFLFPPFAFVLVRQRFG